MSRLFLTVTLITMFSTTHAQTFTDYQWENRVLLLFTPSVDKPEFVEQYERLRQAPDALAERKLKIIVVGSNGQSDELSVFVDGEKAARYYERFEVQENEFALFLIGLDGGTKFQASNEVTPPNQIFALIDRMPMRRREMGY
ncbi:MAG: DUF4174 domain-containing protein [Bacteroidota bacterium]